MNRTLQLYTATTGVTHQALAEKRDSGRWSVHIACGLGNNNRGPSQRPDRLSKGGLDRVTCSKCLQHPFGPQYK